MKSRPSKSLHNGEYNASDTDYLIAKSTQEGVCIKTIWSGNMLSVYISW